jgi:hypothetical protein
MSPADRIFLLQLLGVTVSIKSDGVHLDVIGPAVVVDAATPTLRQHRAELIAHLKQVGCAADLESVARPEPLVSAGVVEALCPKCARS